MPNLSRELIEQSARQLLPPVLTILAAITAYSLIRHFTRAMVYRQQITSIMALRLRMVTRWLIASGSALIVLQQMGVFGQAWTVLSAVAALFAVAFVASWSMLSNATSALLVLLYRPFRVGDEIEVLEVDGKAVVIGRVVDLNLLYTTVLEQSDAVVRVPNNAFVQKYVRVRRHGQAPDPTRDSREPFFTISPGMRFAPKPVEGDAPSSPG